MDCASAWLLALTQAACASDDEGGVGAAFPLPPLALPAPDDHATAARSTLAALLVGSRTCPLVLEPYALDLVRLFCAEAADVHRLSADTTAGPASSIAASAASLADESTCQAVQPWSAALADYLEAVARVTHARTDAVQLAVPVLRAATTCLDALSTCVQAAAASTRGSAATPAATHAALSLEGGLASHDRMEEEVDLLRVGVVVKAAADAVRIARALLLCACRALSVTPSHDEVTSTGAGVGACADAGVGACADAGVSAGAGGHGHALPTHGMPSARSTIVAALPSPALEAAAPGIHGALCSLAAAAAVAEEVMSQPVCHEITLRGLTAALAPTTAAAVQAAAAWRTASSSDDMRVCIAAAAHELGFEAWLAALSRVILFVSDAPSVLSLVQPRDADAHLAVFASGVCFLAAYPQSADAHEAADGAVSRAVYCVRAFGAAQVAAAAASGSQQCPPCAAEATPRAAGEQLLGGVPEIDDSLLLHSVSIVLRGLTASCRAGSRLSARALVDADAAFHALAHITRVAHCHSPLEVGEEVHVHTLECNDDTARCYAWLCALPDDDTLCVADIVAACCDALRSDECALVVAATRAMRTYASVMSLAERALEAETASAALAVADALLQAAGTVLEESVQTHAMQSAAAWSRAVSSSTTTTFDEHTLYKASELVHLVLALVRVPEQADLAVCAAATQGVVTRLVPPSLRMLEAYYEPRGQPPTFVRVSERAKAACEEALLYQFLLLQVCLECAAETVVDASEALQDAVSEASKTKGKSKKTPAVAAAELELRETKRLCTGTLLPALQDIWHALADAMPVLTRVTSHVSVRLNDALRAVLARSEELRDLLPTKADEEIKYKRVVEAGVAAWCAVLAAATATASSSKRRKPGALDATTSALVPLPAVPDCSAAFAAAELVCAWRGVQLAVPHLTDATATVLLQQTLGRMSTALTAHTRVGDALSAAAASTTQWMFVMEGTRFIVRLFASHLRLIVQQADAVTHVLKGCTQAAATWLSEWHLLARHACIAATVHTWLADIACAWYSLTLFAQAPPTKPRDAALRATLLECIPSLAQPLFQRATLHYLSFDTARALGLLRAHTVGGVLHEADWCNCEASASGACSRAHVHRAALAMYTPAMCLQALLLLGNVAAAGMRGTIRGDRALGCVEFARPALTAALPTLVDAFQYPDLMPDITALTSVANDDELLDACEFWPAAAWLLRLARQVSATQPPALAPGGASALSEAPDSDTKAALAPPA